MGTRSLTKFIEKAKVDGKEKKQTIMVMYRQFDGYPEGHGTELADFLKDRKLVNGYGADKNVFNGMGCCAAQVVAHFKKGVGGFYIYPSNTTDAGQDYNYTVEGNFETGELTLSCYEAYGKRPKLLFKGDPKDFAAFVESQKEK